MEGVGRIQIGKAPAIINLFVSENCTSVSRLNVSRFVELDDLAAQCNIQFSSRDRDCNVMRVCSLVCYLFTGMMLRGRFHLNAPLSHPKHGFAIVCRMRGSGEKLSKPEDNGRSFANRACHFVTQ